MELSKARNWITGCMTTALGTSIVAYKYPSSFVRIPAIGITLTIVGVAAGAFKFYREEQWDKHHPRGWRDVNVRWPLKENLMICGIAGAVAGVATMLLIMISKRMDRQSASMIGSGVVRGAKRGILEGLIKFILRV